MKKIYTLLLAVLLIPVSQAQDFRFGKVSLEEVQEKAHPLDPDANAAVLYRSQKTYYEVDNQTGLVLITEVQERIKIYNKDGFDWASRQLSHYETGTSREKISGLKGYTYNIKDGKLTDEKLHKSAIFEEDATSNYKLTKFTMPAVTEGSVIEYTYSLRSPFTSSVDDYALQYTIPINKLEATLQVPEFLVFKAHFNPRSPIPFPVKESMKAFTFTTSRTVRTGTRVVSSKVERNTSNYTQQVYEIDKENIPALKSEAHLDHLSTYAAFWKWELLITKFPNSPIENVTQTWEGIGKSIFMDDGYNRELGRSNYYEKDLKAYLAGVTAPAEKAQKIFEFVKDKVKWNNTIGFTFSNGPAKAYKDGEGTVAEINLMLTSMLKNSGFAAHPVLVSTKNHGVPLFPTRKGFNYIITALEMPDGLVLLDATEENAAFGELPERAMNWQGRLLKDKATSEWVNLMPLTQSANINTVNIQIADDLKLKGKSTTLLNGLFAKEYRDKYKNVTTDSYTGILEKGKGNIQISNIATENQETIGEDIKQTYEFELQDGIEVINDMIYLKPLLFNALSENPFKASERQFPVIFDYPATENKIVNILIPPGYELESMPESAIFELYGGGGTFKFLSVQNGNFLRIESVLDLKNTVYSTMDYPALKDFYTQMVEKHSEAIVLKKTI